MFSETIAFSALVPRAGFEIVPIGDLGTVPLDPPHPDVWPSALVLTERSAGKQAGYRTTRPDSESPALFKDVAALKFTDHSAMVSIANRFGWMTGSPQTLPRADGVGEVQYEFLMHWWAAANNLRWAESLVEAATRSPTHLAKHFRWGRVAEADPSVDEGWYMWASGGRGFVPPPDGTPLTLDLPTPRPKGLNPRWVRLSFDGASPQTDPRLLVEVLLRNVVDSQLKRLTQFRMVTEERTGRRMIEVVPATLDGLLWFQFTRSLTCNKSHRACRECGKWFEVLPKHRGRKEFCDTGCKLKDYRKRKNHAEELKAAGRTPKQIAEQTGTDLETIKKWVGRKKPGGGK